ncbi:MAG TPA: hypothetical protein VIY29_19185 [Ktedonobacteraceae bacterium]
MPAQNRARTGRTNGSGRTPLAPRRHDQTHRGWGLQWPHGWRLTCATYNVTLIAPLRPDACLCAPAPVRQAHELRNEIAEEFMADRVSENYVEQDVALVRSGRTRGMESEKGSR